MADDKALKPKSFRIDDATAEKFKAITSEIGGNQQETMQLLINAYYMQTQKTNLVEHKANIEEFERYATSLITMYTQSLQANHDMKESVMQEFDSLLKSKDATIQDLQKQLEKAKQHEEDAINKAKVYTDENAQLNKTANNLNTEINNLKSMIDDKDNLNKALTDSCNELKVKVENISNAAEQVTSLKNELEQLKKDHENAIQKQSELEKIIADLKQHEADALKLQKEELQLEHGKALLQAEKSYQKELQKLKAENQTEIDKYQSRYLELLEQIKN